ncbi:hypothetical protein [Spirosoma validum]|uniref:Uncharacterized protein n=1 Tax=Spirosoma validum TaxID=2771355 RepID=A0A927GBZ1_9BACT|nr:hypothetical protein [Spirosoma validum]MBD2752108.1 hypothetical protein [Spirosoma validum]
MGRYTDDLKQQIERILHWEPSSHWRLRDFVSLSELVRTHTRQYVDAQELQAFWKSSAVTSPVFLDTLAQFADYVDWNDFCDRNFYGVMEHDDETELLHAPMWEIPVRWVIGICWFSIIVSVVIGILLVWKR